MEKSKQGQGKEKQWKLPKEKSVKRARILIGGVKMELEITEKELNAIREKRNEYMREYRSRPENKERLRLKQKEYNKRYWKKKVLRNK